MSIFLLTLTPRNYTEDDYAKLYSVCKGTADATCGKLKPGYPFWGDYIRPAYCGIEELKLTCENSELFIHFGSVISKYRVIDIKPATSELELVRSVDLLEGICAIDTKISSTILNETLFAYGEDTEVLHFFYNCPRDNYINYVEESFTCPVGDTDRKVIVGNESFFKAQGDNLSSCKNITVPVRKIEPEILPVDVVKLKQLFHMSFQVHYYINETACSHCIKTKGLCWRDTGLPTNQTCLYEYAVPSIDDGKNKKGLTVVLATVAGSVGLLLLVLVCFICYCWKRDKHGSSVVSRNVSSYSFSMSDSEKGGGNYMGVPTFSYNELEKATNNFDSSNELGDGGFGTVYKGKLQDGREVAVKRLYENNFKRVEQFMNEIAILEPLRHPNLVVLYGSTSSECRKLPSTTMEGQHLGWEKLYSIALGIARGLEYLHQGCNTRILHFDIKPHNILLDEDFRPKISDFGLAKLYNEKESNVSSIMQARGTIGYIAPEVFSRNFGQVSHKSDVYSYGMMILEMVGGRRNVNAGADHTSEIYYPHWLYKRIAFTEELCFGSEMSEEETEIARKMVIVGLWCIQTNPMERPYISKVIEMLEGKIASLEIPPKPYLCSPPNSPSNSQPKPLFSSS